MALYFHASSSNSASSSKLDACGNGEQLARCEMAVACAACGAKLLTGAADRESCSPSLEDSVRITGKVRSISPKLALSDSSSGAYPKNIKDDPEPVSEFIPSTTEQTFGPKNGDGNSAHTEELVNTKASCKNGDGRGANLLSLPCEMIPNMEVQRPAMHPAYTMSQQSMHAATSPYPIRKKSPYPIRNDTWRGRSQTLVANRRTYSSEQGQNGNLDSQSQNKNPLDANVELFAAVAKQIEYYFSVENLIKDVFLRSNMDNEGFVPASLIATFPKIKGLGADLDIILKALHNSRTVEVQDKKLRRSKDWVRWLLNKKDIPYLK